MTMRSLTPQRLSNGFSNQTGQPKDGVDCDPPGHDSAPVWILISPHSLSNSGISRVPTTNYHRQRIFNVLPRTNCPRLQAKPHGNSGLGIDRFRNVPFLVWALCNHDMDVALVRCQALKLWLPASPAGRYPAVQNRTLVRSG